MHLFTLYSTSLKCLITLGYSHWSPFCAFGLCGLTNAVLSTYSGLPWMLNERKKLSFLEQCFQGVGFWSVKGVVLFLHSQTVSLSEQRFPAKAFSGVTMNRAQAALKNAKGFFFFNFSFFDTSSSILSISIPPTHLWVFGKLCNLSFCFIYFFIPTYLMGCLFVGSEHEPYVYCGSLRPTFPVCNTYSHTFSWLCGLLMSLGWSV